MGVCGTVEFFWLHQTILPPTPILLHGPLKKPSHPLLFYLSNCYWQKTSTFARVFFQWSRVKKQRKHYKEHEIMHYYYSFIILKHHFFCHTTPEYTSQNPAAGSLGGGGILVLNSKTPSKLVFICIRSAMNKEMFIYIYLGSLQFSALNYYSSYY